MSRVRVHNFSVSLDGFGTGEGQSLESPFGHAGSRLHEWFFPTRSFQEMQGNLGGTTGIDDAFAKAWAPGIGAEIMGRNKFGPQRGPWVDDDWKGWWGGDPPFHTPVFILTHHPRPADRDGGRNDVSFHRRRPRRGPGNRPGSGGWPGCPNWWRANNSSPIPGSQPGRLHAHRDRAHRPRPRGASVGRSRGTRAAL